MAKVSTSYFCQNCGAESAKWIGRCPACNEWNTYVEEKTVATSKKTTVQSYQDSKPKTLNEVETDSQQRIVTQYDELNRVLGGGFVKGSLVLIGGEPGIGKSTLALQVALSSVHQEILYVSGEESLDQIKLRANRLKENQHHGWYYNEISLEKIIQSIEDKKPSIVVIDSIQTIYSDALDASPGSISQVRECATRLLKLAKEKNTVVVLIGHITKDGSIAGPKVLEHIVDVVLQFEGDHQMAYRMLRAKKNRFGSTAELGLFEMQVKGLIEIKDPSDILINRDDEQHSGVAVAVTINGNRTLLVEVQALVSTAVYGTPQRTANGFDTRRLNMLLAVLEKRAGFHLGTKDVFINIAGGVKIDDPALDLAVISAILSSSLDKAIAPTSCFAGEVSLTGVIRPASRSLERTKEAARLGYKQLLMAHHSKKGSGAENAESVIYSVTKVEDVFRKLFGKGG